MKGMIEGQASQYPSSITCTYLAFNDWSPRYDATSFFTIQFAGYVLVTSQEQLNTLLSTPNPSTNDKPVVLDDDLSVIKTKAKAQLPAYYFKCVVYRGHHTIILYRPYIHFEWLYQQLQKSTTLPIDFPHPLQGDTNDECSFLGGTHCVIVRHLQEAYDYILHRRSYDSTTNNNNEYTSKFAETRCQQLSYFLTTVLESPTYTNHSATRQFLEL